jgi:predicted lipoprotein with Yx(FWY)xxD motif
MARRLLVLAVLAATAFGACGGGGSNGYGSSTSSATTAKTATTASTKATVQVAKTGLGDVLVDADGHTLYLFTKDANGTSACTGGCAATWPPLAASGSPTAGDGVDASKFGTLARDDGMSQVTFAGKPLYRYGPDKAAGDTNGQGVGGVWFAVRPDGSAASATGSGTPSY